MKKMAFHLKSKCNLLFIMLICTLLMIPVCATAKTPKNIFLFIGDGMGFPQKTAAEQYSKSPLMIDTLPYQGVTTTPASNRFITGSAAAATAMACGKKTSIGRIAMDADMTPLVTIAEMAKERGMKVGIVSSVSIDHATPAAFYAHVPSRSQYYDIDIALAKSGFDYFAGGGLKDPANKKGNATNFEGDAMELILKNGYKVVRTRDEFNALSPEAGKVLAINGWLQDSGALPYDMDRTESDISLAEFTDKGIELLENDNGFFMMVEGGKIDWACHANDAAAAIKDTLAFDKAVEKAYAFYKKHPEDTLIIVTGDHECGGMSIGFAGTQYETYFDVLKHQKISFTQFDQTIIKSLKEKTETPAFDSLKSVITENFGLAFTGDEKNTLLLKPHEVAQLEAAFVKTMKGDTEGSNDPETYLLYGGYEPLTVSITHILNQKAGIAWTSYNHTGVPIATSAVGIGAESYQGAYDNTDIALKLMDIMGIKAAPVYAVN
ncbi:Alkaline phosphatase [Desulfamplus magnetovallimortis]|uniref:Alkaline phosphatase n=1 Tax=Desulfamplus magnetovallimortis TaxID=1246637 RepID=A0A1W1HK53_9BACT|nr:alkaline phosphatase [Desulfamplus magnetovallimortis]SLM32897.1 Alkaline phosphatase [Desulfamplus magnetovallimortis]